MFVSLPCFIRLQRNELIHKYFLDMVQGHISASRWTPGFNQVGYILKLLHDYTYERSECVSLAFLGLPRWRRQHLFIQESQGECSESWIGVNGHSSSAPYEGIGFRKFVQASHFLQRQTTVHPSSMPFWNFSSLYRQTHVVSKSWEHQTAPPKINPPLPPPEITVFHLLLWDSTAVPYG